MLNALKIIIWLPGNRKCLLFQLQFKKSSLLIQRCWIVKPFFQTLGAPEFLLDIAKKIRTYWQLMHCTTKQLVINIYYEKLVFFTLKTLLALGHGPAGPILPLGTTHRVIEVARTLTQLYAHTNDVTYRLPRSQIMINLLLMSRWTPNTIRTSTRTHTQSRVFGNFRYGVRGIPNPCWLSLTHI